MSDWSWTDAISATANVATVIALVFTLLEFRSGRRAASASAVISINESFRQAWTRFLDAPADDERRRYAALADIANLVETGCALQEDAVFAGRSGELLENYLCYVLSLFNNDATAKGMIERMLHDPTTFRHMLRFIQAHPERVRIRIDPPPPG